MVSISSIIHIHSPATLLCVDFVEGSCFSAADALSSAGSPFCSLGVGLTHRKSLSFTLGHLKRPQISSASIPFFLSGLDDPHPPAGSSLGIQILVLTTTTRSSKQPSGLTCTLSTPLSPGTTARRPHRRCLRHHPQASTSYFGK